MSTQPPITVDLLDRFFASETTIAESHMVRTWLAANPTVEAEWRERSRGANLDPASRAQWDVLRMRMQEDSVMLDGATSHLSVTPQLDSLRAQPHTEKAPAQRASVPRMRRGAYPNTKNDSSISLRSHRIVQLFQGALGVLTIVALLFIGRQWHSIYQASPAKTVTTGIGQRIQLELSNGVHVTLAPQSRLLVRGTEATLSGEAYFTVSHHPAVPFIVRTGPVRVRVLGTAFDVRRYDTDAATRVVVTEGKVAAGTTTLVTVPAQRVARVTDSTVTVTSARDVTAYTAWTVGRLVFNDVPARELLETVGQWYGLQFRYTDPSLASEPITARFEQQSVADVLAAIRTVLHVTMTFHGNTVILAPVRASSTGLPRRVTRDSFSTLPHEMGR